MYELFWRPALFHIFTYNNPKNSETLKVVESYRDINWCILLWEPNILMESIYFLQRFSHTFDGLIHRRMSRTTSQRRYKFLLQCLQTAILFHCLIDSFILFKEKCGRKLCDNEKLFWFLINKIFLPPAISL